jgi:hypothetical protein
MEPRRCEYVDRQPDGKAMYLRCVRLRPRIAQRTDDFVELIERPRPTVRKEQRDGVGVGRALMNEMHGHISYVDRGVIEPGDRTIAMSTCLRSKQR